MLLLLSALSWLSPLPVVIDRGIDSQVVSYHVGILWNGE